MASDHNNPEPGSGELKIDNPDKALLSNKK